jgi:hypothetical protein
MRLLLLISLSSSGDPSVKAVDVLGTLAVMAEEAFLGRAVWTSLARGVRDEADPMRCATLKLQPKDDYDA